MGSTEGREFVLESRLRTFRSFKQNKNTWDLLPLNIHELDSISWHMAEIDPTALNCGKQLIILSYPTYMGFF